MFHRVQFLAMAHADQLSKLAQEELLRSIPLDWRPKFSGRKNHRPHQSGSNFAQIFVSWGEFVWACWLNGKNIWKQTSRRHQCYFCDVTTTSTTNTKPLLSTYIVPAGSVLSTKFFNFRPLQAGGCSRASWGRFEVGVWCSCDVTEITLMSTRSLFPGVFSVQSTSSNKFPSWNKNLGKMWARLLRCFYFISTS